MTSKSPSVFEYLIEKAITIKIWNLIIISQLGCCNI